MSRRLAFWLALYAAGGTLAARTCYLERAEQLERQRQREEAPSSLSDTCPDSLLSTGCHPAWEVEAWYSATGGQPPQLTREDSLQLEQERGYREAAGCSPDFNLCHGIRP
jgi:hypothetical protein